MAVMENGCLDLRLDMRDTWYTPGYFTGWSRAVRKLSISMCCLWMIITACAVLLIRWRRMKLFWRQKMSNMILITCGYMMEKK